MPDEGVGVADRVELGAGEDGSVPAQDCDPSYPDVCLDPSAEDYDCAGGSGSGPEYVEGPIRVRPPDPFGLDADGDGWGCEGG